MRFYCAMAKTDSVCWQDGEQTVNPITGEIQPIGFQPDFVCEWDGISDGYVRVFGVMPVIPEFQYTDEAGNIVIITAHTSGIPFAGWPQVEV